MSVCIVKLKERVTYVTGMSAKMTKKINVTLYCCTVITLVCTEYFSEYFTTILSFD